MNKPTPLEKKKKWSPSLEKILGSSERFWSKVEKTDGCWLWKSTKIPNGYGQMHFGHKYLRKPMLAHRVSWILHNKTNIPDGLFVCHHCDNPPCVRPDHLFAGTRSDNMLDCSKKGRMCPVGQSKKTHCVNGHPFDEANTAIHRNGYRVCRKCHRWHDKKAKRLRAARNPYETIYREWLAKQEGGR